LGNSPLPFNYQTLPMHVMDSYNPLNMPEGYCRSRLDTLRAKNDPVMKDEIDSLLAYFKLTYGEALRKSLNLTDYDFSNYMKIASISDTFIANDFEKRDLSNLGVNLTQFNETMKYINSLSWKAFDNSTDMSKLTMTPILKTITTQMSAHIAGSTSAPKAIIYSGHDTTILLMLNFLKKSLNLDYNLRISCLLRIFSLNSTKMTMGHFRSEFFIMIMKSTMEILITSTVE